MILIPLWFISNNQALRLWEDCAESFAFLIISFPTVHVCCKTYEEDTTDTVC